VPLAPFDLLARVVTPPPPYGRFDNPIEILKLDSIRARHYLRWAERSHDVHSLRTAVHVPQRYADVPGLEVSLGNVLKDLFVQAQLGNQPLELTVLLLKLF
jgi:hypothetical protein